MPSPSPVSPGPAHLWTLTLPTISSPSALSSFPLLSSTTELPPLALHPEHTPMAPKKPAPPAPCASLSAACSLSLLLRGALTGEGNAVRAGEGLLPARGSDGDPARPTHPPASHGTSDRALPGSPHTQAVAPRTQRTLAAGGVFGEGCNKLGVQESTTF